MDQLLALRTWSSAAAGHARGAARTHAAAAASAQELPPGWKAVEVIHELDHPAALGRWRRWDHRGRLLRRRLVQRARPLGTRPRRRMRRERHQRARPRHRARERGCARGAARLLHGVQRLGAVHRLERSPRLAVERRLPAQRPGGHPRRGAPARGRGRPGWRGLGALPRCAPRHQSARQPRAAGLGRRRSEGAQRAASGRHRVDSHGHLERHARDADARRPGRTSPGCRRW